MGFPLVGAPSEKILYGFPSQASCGSKAFLSNAPETFSTMERGGSLPTEMGGGDHGRRLGR